MGKRRDTKIQAEHKERAALLLELLLGGHVPGQHGVPERSDGGEAFGGLREVAEQRQLGGVIQVLQVPVKVNKHLR